MAQKRNAARDLNEDNWDEEEEPEECGTFARASEDELKKRVFKSARRKLTSEDDSQKKLFSSFTGFGKSASSPAPFSFLANTSGSSNGLSSASKSAEVPQFPIPSFSTKPSFKCSDNAGQEPASAGDAGKPAENSEYLAKLKGLNEGVAKWIKTHVDSNPFCILSPIFKDYEKYLAEIDSDKAEGKSSDEKKASDAGQASAPAVSAPLMFGGANTTSASPIFNPFVPPKTDTFKLNEQSPFKSSSSPFSTQLGGSTVDSPSSGFSFGTGAPFTFANVSKPVAMTDEAADEDVEEPPKNEFTPVVEEDSTFSKRCKVFVKASGNFKERGVGTLFLKPVAESGKTQLLVRADTSLGNVLLNFILAESIPTQRMGKNNVLLVCLPTPEEKPPPTPVLLRVKTPEEADELLEVLNKHKK